MAANKFFTWNKGEKKQLEAMRSAGIVPIPIECIAIKGLDYDSKSKGTIKNNRKPLSLSIDHDFDYASTRSARTVDSMALQDAAVQNATNLMTVINEMLRSPQLTNLIASQPNLFTPTHARFRANTAPTTPMVEAPVMEPVELVGSSPSSSQRPFPVHSHSYEGHIARSEVSTVTCSAVGGSIDRPKSCTQSSSCSYPLSARRSEEMARRYPSHPAFDPIPRSTSADPYQRRAFYHDQFSPHTDTLVSSMTLTDAAMTKHTGRNYDNAPYTPSQTPRAYASSSSLGTFRTDSATGMSAFVTEASEQDAETVLMNQISAMRTAHEHHISSLREAHERELDSLRAYVAVLEKRRAPLSPYPLSPNQPLAVDTSQMGVGGNASVELSAATSAQSFETALEQQRRASPDLVAETERLKRKLSLFRKTQADLNDVKRQRDLLRETTENDQRRINQLKDIIRKAKENDKALRGAIDDLEGRLEAANNERVDALETIHETSAKVKQLSEREDELLHDREELCTRLFDADPGWDGLVLGKKVASPHLSPEVDILHEQIDDLRHCLKDKDARIQALEQRNQRSMIDAEVQTEASDSVRQDVPPLVEQAHDHCRESLASAERDRDRFHSLLQAELRRQARIAAKTSVAITPRIADEAVAMAISRVPSLRAQITTQNSDGLDTPPTGTEAEMEQELKHCMREIIMYKLDIKGYKKDIRKAQAEIASLKASFKVERPPTPDSGEKPPVKERVRGTRKTSQTVVEGLGISLLPPPLTPVRVTRTDPLHSASIDRPHRHSSSVPAAHSPRYREASHKKLPRQPSKSPSPPHAARAVAATPEVPGDRTEEAPALSGLVIFTNSKTDALQQGTLIMATTAASTYRSGRSSAPPVFAAADKQSRVEKTGLEQMKVSLRDEGLVT